MENDLVKLRHETKGRITTKHERSHLIYDRVIDNHLIFCRYDTFGCISLAFRHVRMLFQGV